MKNIIVYILGTFVLCASCNSTGKKSINIPARKYINVVKNVNGYNVAYTEDGHTMLYTIDSIGKYSVYYVKFENGAGKYGLKGIEEKTIMFQLDSTLSSLESFVSFQGGSFCEVDSLTGYKAYFFDDQLKGDSVVIVDTPVNPTQIEGMEVEREVKRISELINVAYYIALSISKNNQRGWNDVVYALEPTHELLSFEVMVISDVYDKRVQKRLPKMQNIAKELTEFYLILQETIIDYDVIGKGTKKI